MAMEWKWSVSQVTTNEILGCIATFDTSWEVKTELSARSYIESSLPKTALQNKR